MTKHVIVGTAGHIDHGKTALVRALTGIDTDRWEEEKRRGITIDIGFAHLDIAPDLKLGFVDVPGHERFVKNMLAGVGGIDIVLLVVAADEGVMPQTREHFDICRLLGVRKGIVVLTKIDLAEPDLRELVELDLQQLVAGSFLEGAPIVCISAKSGEGLEPLRKTLEGAAREVEAKNSRYHFRLPIDRVFIMKGFGTVVTGTMVSGSVEVESEVEVYPLGRRARVRGLEVHNRSTQSALAGQRTAVNLAGLQTDLLQRGMVLAAPAKFEGTQQIDSVLDLLSSSKPLKHGAPVHFHSGTAETPARVYFLDRRKALNPGGRAYAQVRLRDPLLVLAGDRFILRQFSPVVTIGGGRVLDAHAHKHSASEDWRPRLEALESGEPERVLEMLIAERPYGAAGHEIVARSAWLDDEVSRVARVLENKGVATRLREDSLWLIHHRQLRAALESLVAFLRQFHKANPLLPGASKEALRSARFSEAPPFFLDVLLDRLVQDKKLAVEGELVRLAGHQVRFQEDERQARERMVSTFRDAGLTVPAISEILSKLPIDSPRARKILQVLLREQVLVRISEELVFHRDAIENVKQLLRQEKSRSQRIAVPRFKDLTGVSRKYAIPLLEYLDREKITRRVGDSRVIL